MSEWSYGEVPLFFNFFLEAEQHNCLQSECVYVSCLYDSLGSRVLLILIWYETLITM